jgi:polysaccharide chain length determinant protein (PEP-CTERM system associated)
MLQTPKFQIWPLINLSLRRKWWIIVPFVLAMSGGMLVLAVAPKSYKATTLILLEPQSIPESFIRSTVTETVEGRLRTMSEQIRSRTNLEKIIKEFQLDQKPDPTASSKGWEVFTRFLPSLKSSSTLQGQTPESERGNTQRLVDAIRQNLQANLVSGSSSGKGQNVAFEISLEWNDIDLVAPVTNAVAARFIQDNLSAREEVAMGTTDFLDTETSALRVEIESREKELEAFKKAHMGMLPDQLQSNINILNQLRDRVQNLERRLDQEKQQSIILRSQYQIAQVEREAAASTLRQERGRHASGGSLTGSEGQASGEELVRGSLEDLERELKRLASSYTEQHPDIVALKKRISALRAEGTRKDESTPGNSVSTRSDSSQGRLNLQLAAINTNIESYKAEIKETEKELEIYRTRVERTPQVEMELNKILRDYQTVRQRYDGLLTKKMDAKLAEQMEKRKKGEQFRILDPAIRPSKPFKPDPLRIVLMSLGVGLGLGCGLAYFRESLDPAFYSREELEAYLGTEVIVSLPIAELDSRS